ncbi:MAG: NAD(P)H-dependent glycerol-3-phosphate dehydrogenase [Clostridiales bacterium]|jgi:glycerol-3-phosphate dehydrogenase (NAD(P)+)|nr:NAD(P)H-dependent glycerol-3-phosphate dehydrogenase [Clostridiales bacterium]
MKVSVLGCGRWGSFIAWYLDHIGKDVTLWGLPDSPHYQRLQQERKNDLLELPDSIKLTSNLEEAVKEAEIFVISISAQALRDFASRLVQHKLGGKPIVLCMKGIEETTGNRLSEIMEQFTKKENPIAIWVGPGHVQDFIRGIPNCMVIDSKNDAVKRELVHAFSSELIRFYYGTDLIGNEIGAAAKNVIGIAAGMLDGVNYSSLKGALMSRGTREIARLIKAMGGNEISAYGLCHLGDYQATLFSEHSHNRKFGEMFILGKPYTELAEGVSTTRALIKLGEQYHVDLPICKAVDAIVNHGNDPQQVLSGLFIRSLKEEF